MSNSRERSTFTPDEVALVVRRFALASILAAEELAVGSSRSPKLILRTRSGDFLLKRRAEDASREARVRFTQAVQMELERRGVHVARLIRTDGGGAPALRADGQIYEVFQFIRGVPYASEPRQAFAAAHALGSMHRAMREWVPPVPSPEGNYHAARSMGKLIDRARSTSLALLAKANKVVDEAAFASALHLVGRSYAIAVDRASLGVTGERCVNHADFHPGNTIFAETGAVSAIVDFDSARLEDPILDFSNGLLQFGHPRRRGRDPRRWALALEDALAKPFIEGYAAANPEAEIRDRAGAVPWLMVEAAVAEAVVALARAGRLGPIPGPQVVEHLRTRVDWLVFNAGRISTLVEQCARPQTTRRSSDASS